MSPRKSRRRNFAVPFVLTVAFAPGCVVKDRPVNPPGPPPTAAHDGRGDGGRGDGDAPPTDPRAQANDSGDGREAPPPDPRTDADGEDGTPAHKPVIIANPPPQPATQVPAGWSWRQGKDGTCWAYPPPPACKPNATCNPPPAKKIDCPADDGPVED
jgi:hypothetical protein